MPDIFDDLNKNLIPILIKYLNDPNTKISENFESLLNDPKIFLSDFIEKFSKNYNQTGYSDSLNIPDLQNILDDEYDELFIRLKAIEDNMIKLENLLEDKNERHQS